MIDAKFLERDLGIDFYLARSREEDTKSDKRIAELGDYIGGLVAVFFAPAERDTPEWTDEREVKMRASIVSRGKYEAREAGCNMRVVFLADGTQKRQVANVRWDSRKRGPVERDE